MSVDSAISAFLARTHVADPPAKAGEGRLLVDSTLAVSRAPRPLDPSRDHGRASRARPSADPRTWFEGREAVLFAESLSAGEKAALRLVHQDPEALVKDANEWIVRSELHQRRPFFERVESNSCHRGTDLRRCLLRQHKETTWLRLCDRVMVDGGFAVERNWLDRRIHRLNERRSEALNDLERPRCFVGCIRN